MYGSASYARTETKLSSVLLSHAQVIHARGDYPLSLTGGALPKPRYRYCRRCGAHLPLQPRSEERGYCPSCERGQP